MATPILFNPSKVQEVLVGLPALAALVPDPADEGVDSEAFPGVLRKTRRELYRWIANTHYDHLADVVPILEPTHAAGCRFGNLLSTRSRERFMSHAAEMLVAHDLMRRGYNVATVPLANHAAPTFTSPATALTWQSRSTALAS
ncbi:MAG: hypothetical protein U0R50_13870 [Gaiellales bacterium]